MLIQFALCTVYPDAEVIASLFVYAMCVVRPHGMPNVLVTGRGSQLCNKSCNAVCKAVGTTQSTTYGTGRCMCTCMCACAHVPRPPCVIRLLVWSLFVS